MQNACRLRAGRDQTTNFPAPVEFGISTLQIKIIKIIIKVQLTLQISKVCTTIQHVWFPACVFQNPFCCQISLHCALGANYRFMYRLPCMDAGEIRVYRQTKMFRSQDSEEYFQLDL